MTPDLRELLRPRVERGAALLDSVEPRWWKRVEEALDLSRCDRCVLGQVYGSYLDGLRALQPMWDDGEEERPGSLGFAGTIDASPTKEYWATLDALWLEAIEARRTA